MDDRKRRDRRGEPFADANTENRGVRRPQIEKAQHDLDTQGEDVTTNEEREEHDGS